MDPIQMTLADLAVTHPAASRVFQARRLDYCCHGRRPLSDACAEKGLDPREILDEITKTDELHPPIDWASMSDSDLVDFIVNHYHARLRAELPDLVGMAEKVERRHAEKSSCPAGLARHLRAVHLAVNEHLEKEEKILFPMLAGGSREHAAGPIQVMEREHDDHARDLARTRALTHDFVAPEEACTTWQALYLRLSALEAELMEHIHLENNVLFSRALAG